MDTLTRLTVAITGMDDAGAGVAHVAGRRVLVPHSLPGDVVEIALTHARRHTARAKILRILTPGRARTPPRCQHLVACGGCTWQHIDYAAQLQFKTERVLRALCKIARVDMPEVRACRASTLPYAYRNRMQFPRMLKIDTCAIAEAPINAQLAGRDEPLVRIAELHGEHDLRAVSAVSADGAAWMIVGQRRYQLSDGTFFR